MENDAQHRRLRHPHQSHGAKQGWLRHRANYMRGIRKRERDNMNDTKTFYDVSKDLEEALKEIDEAKVNGDIFDLACTVAFDNIAGGLSFKINPDNGTVSFTADLTEQGQGNYKLLNALENEDDYRGLYEELKDELEAIVSTIDTSIKQVIARHGLSQT